jgi:spore cortex formation protein SpoVR/YcgB (stage V sporulation)
MGRRDPDIQVIDVDLTGDRRLELRHTVLDGVTLEGEGRRPRAAAPGRPLGL